MLTSLSNFFQGKQVDKRKEGMILHILENIYKIRELQALYPYLPIVIKTDDFTKQNLENTDSEILHENISLIQEKLNYIEIQYYL